jgi:hypothetical protein
MRALLEHARYPSHKITHYQQNAVHPDCNRKLKHRNRILWTPVRNVVTTLTELSRVDRMISELRIGKDVEITIHGLICGTIAECLQRLKSRTPVPRRRCENANEWGRVDWNVRLIRTDRPRVHVPLIRQTQVHRHALLRPGMSALSRILPHCRNSNLRTPSTTLFMCAPRAYVSNR